MERIHDKNFFSKETQEKFKKRLEELEYNKKNKESRNNGKK